MGKKTKRQIRYCSHCGKRMKSMLLGAETNMMFYGDMSTIPLASAYNKNTGKRQYCYRYTCPDFKKKMWGLIFSKHNDYFIDEVIFL